MPEIIRFSNDLCYTDTPLIPLRQYPPSRLSPIQVRFVVNGYREGKGQDSINRPEAAALVWTLLDTLNDPRYKGKSFGVICLQGHAQSQLIENMILDKIGPQPFKDERPDCYVVILTAFRATNVILCSSVWSHPSKGKDVSHR